MFPRLPQKLLTLNTVIRCPELRMSSPRLLSGS